MSNRKSAVNCAKRISKWIQTTIMKLNKHCVSLAHTLVWSRVAAGECTKEGKPGGDLIMASTLPASEIMLPKMSLDEACIRLLLYPIVAVVMVAGEMGTDPVYCTALLAAARLF